MFSARVLSRAVARQQPVLRRFNSNSASQIIQGSKAEGNAFIAEREAIRKHAAESAELWRKLSIYATVPFLIIAAVNAKNLWDEHWEHWSHMPPLEERTEYSYQNIRAKNFPWGDGDKTLFWNDKVNYHKTE
ncbi:cytochrome c oxidase-like protein [Pyronema domesticum]|uniref:Cytochrome c oxidase subunit n=1 Tax=Pyronema omphalodes (strain CBS 100304) TaxID=1076935 RepID=U4LF64_PYROM|nr:cytochrome c oxidase-like protein [Pyronema domesticum]CCX13586.1 Similar to Cytochrome c oxidase subunit 6A, mitochondrial; acc. no. O74471 [Pyronema omphalodes CBS 100304]